MPATIDPQSLQRAVTQGFDRVENFRRARYRFMTEYVGQYYDKADGIGEEAQPINLIFKAISILVPHLVSKNPEHDVESRYAMYGSTAELLKLYLDDLVKKIGYKHELRLTIIDALMSMGIIKDGLGVSGQSLDGPDGLANLAMPYASRVDLDDFTIDPLCRNIREALFVGSRVRVPRAFVEESGLFNLGDMRLPSIQDQTRKGREVSSLSRNKRKHNRGEENNLVDYMDLVEVYLPDARKIVTLPFGDNMMVKDFLRVVDYDGPEVAGDSPVLGPYHLLGFHWVPNNPFPIPPCGIWMDLHEMANSNAAKATRQADRQKEILVYGRGAADDAEQVAGASDGESIAVDHPDMIKSITFGGTNDAVYQHLDWIKREFGESGPGDFQQLGGEASSAGTATQANILASAANIRVGDMKDLIYDFTSSISRSLAWYGFTDPLLELPLKKRIPGGEDVTLMLTPEAIHGDFLDYHFDISLESMDRENPLQRSQKLIQFVQTVIPTAIQTFMQFFQIGMPQMFNPIKFININAKLQGIDHFEAVWGDPEFQMMVMEMLAKAPIMQGAQGMPGEPTGAGPEGMGARAQLGPGGGGGGGGGMGGFGGMPKFQAQGLDPRAELMKSFAQSGSAPMQLGMGNPTGLRGGAPVF